MTDPTGKPKQGGWATPPPNLKAMSKEQKYIHFWEQGFNWGSIAQKSGCQSIGEATKIVHRFLKEQDK
nr:hypothetical protein 5 [Desulfobulbaceae bacterium]